MKNKKNTSPVLRIPTSIRFGIWLSQKLSTSVATQFALYLFIRPQRFKRPVREQNMHEHALKTSCYIPKIDKEIQVFRFAGKGAKILLLHGWSGRGTQLFAFADKLRKSNAEIVTFDMPAHGQSLGNKTNIVELVACIKEVYTKYGPFDHAIAHSMGSMALLRALRDGIPIKSAAIIGSGDKIRNVFYRFSEQLQFSDKVTERMIKTVEKQFGMNLESYSSSMSLEHLKLPLLIVHDKDDKETPFACSKDLHEIANNSELLLTSGLGHHRILRDSKTVQHIVQFINQHP
ncbi:MAG: alpha/beta hydrolase [Flavobacteriaceae bacterium]|nr:alpha/beta hydrolase [Flavobacteriaceae bacterium]